MPLLTASTTKFNPYKKCNPTGKQEFQPTASKKGSFKMIAVKITIALCSILALADCSFLAQFARRDEPIAERPHRDSCLRAADRCGEQAFTSQEYPYVMGSVPSKPMKDIYGKPEFATIFCHDVTTFRNCIRVTKEQLCTGSQLEDVLEMAETFGDYFCGLRFQTLLPLAAQSPCVAGIDVPSDLMVEYQTCQYSKMMELQSVNDCTTFEIVKQCALSTSRRLCGAEITMLVGDLLDLAQTQEQFSDCSQDQAPAQAFKRAVSNFLNKRK